ncbi:translation elongation factor 4 [Candidatus Contubernalis alkaliaceticus]|uniref:translation elongation factor 4 n=1 Tax=Candidatus Contubernalis alkaliaceticus TaxID=338645 RepID=UPI001F4C0C32|nr:translation elongation factor 4 [Candidatus Contubernalis alkalaceticus]UNC91000.1 elongation factor 4 [Candidatus Contubernalis alkalaceticus]
MSPKNIRNFCIIAHIDHGKSTLADRLLEKTGALTQREMKEQVLDSMDLERERGITIKLQAVRLVYRAKDGEEYILNLIDTPGHVDFTYEVSRSLAACEGALLIVDAAQGMEAQTLANAYLALEHGLEIIPVINKIDLPSADPQRVKRELEETLALDASEALLVSAKEGTGTEEVLEAVVKRISPPEDSDQESLRSLIFDSHYDPYRGVIAYIRVKEGTIQKGQKIKLMNTGKVFEVSETGIFLPAMTSVSSLSSGDVGYVIAGIKNVAEAQVGDTITSEANPGQTPLAGYRKVVPMVYCGLFPLENTEFDEVREALEKLKLNDAALSYEPETSAALGFGFRCGFLGLLHMEIVQERLEREYGLNLITTAPNVIYRIILKDGQETFIDNPSNYPPVGDIERVEEPFVQAGILVPGDYVGTVMELCQDKRGNYETMNYMETGRVMLTYSMPLAEIIFDFFDQLKSKTRGYASLDYKLTGYKMSHLSLVDILVNNQKVDALSFIVHRERAFQRGKDMVERLKKMIPRQLFEVPIQAVVGNKVLARETIKALGKNVTDKCYGGDITRKRKLWEKQKMGKKRMKQVGNVQIPQEAFMAVLNVDK